MWERPIIGLLLPYTVRRPPCGHRISCMGVLHKVTVWIIKYQIESVLQQLGYIEVCTGTIYLIRLVIVFPRLTVEYFSNIHVVQFYPTCFFLRLMTLVWTNVVFIFFNYSLFCSRSIKIVWECYITIMLVFIMSIYSYVKYSWIEQYKR